MLAGEAVGAGRHARAARCARPAALLAAALGLVLAALASRARAAATASRAHWDELGDGLGRGLEALTSVRLPYIGVDPWPDITLRLGGALLVTLAALLAAWPRADGPPLPVLRARRAARARGVAGVRVGTPRSLVLGLAIAALTACFLWLERLPRRPGLGLAVLGRDRARGRAPARRRGRPRGAVVRLQALAEGLGTPAPVRFDWDHGYGPIDWPREGREMLRVRVGAAAVLEARDLEDFDGERWVERARARPVGAEPEDDLPQNWPRTRSGRRGARRPCAACAATRRRRRHDALGRRRRDAP